MKQCLFPTILLIVIAILYVLSELRIFHRGGDVFGWTKRLAIFLIPIKCSPLHKMGNAALFLAALSLMLFVYEITPSVS